MRYTYTMEYRSTAKRREFCLSEWMNLAPHKVKEVRERQILFNITYMWNLKNTINVNKTKRITDKGTIP